MAKNPPEVGYLKEGHSEENYLLLIKLPEEPNTTPIHPRKHPHGEEPPQR